jgi:hypothetical protein
MAGDHDCIRQGVALAVLELVLQCANIASLVIVLSLSLN